MIGADHRTTPRTPVVGCLRFTDLTEGIDTHRNTLWREAYNRCVKVTTVQQSAVKWRLALAAISAVIAVLFGVLGSVVSLLAFLVAVPFAVAAILLWRQAHAGLNSVGSHRRSATSKGQRSAPGHRDRRGHATGKTQSLPTRVSAAEARSVLDVPRDADDATVRQAYRRRIKDVHPDQGGEEEAFRRVTAAYERLSDGDDDV